MKLKDELIKVAMEHPHVFDRFMKNLNEIDFSKYLKCQYCKRSNLDIKIAEDTDGIKVQICASCLAKFSAATTKHYRDTQAKLNISEEITFDV